MRIGKSSKKSQKYKNLKRTTSIYIFMNGLLNFVL